MNHEIVFPIRPFRDVHQLVFLLQSWQLLLEATELPPELVPLREIPDRLSSVMQWALREARAQLEDLEAGDEIALRLPATDEFVELLRWAEDRFSETAGLVGGSLNDPTWTAAIELARDMVRGALEGAPRTADDPV